MIDNILVMAYLGDAIYELKVRCYLTGLGIVKLKELKTASLKYVSAVRQAYFLDKITDNLTPIELDIVRRGRNAKTNSKPRNTDVLTYKHATALEALFGYLYINKCDNRIDELFDLIVKCGD